MSRGASHEPEAFAGLHLEQSLDLELSLGGSGKRNSHVNDGLPLRLFAIEGRLDEHEARTAQNAVDQKKVVEPIRMYRRNPAPFHCNVPPALVVGASYARHNTATARTAYASEHCSQEQEKAASRILPAVPVSERDKGRSGFTTTTGAA